MKNAYSNFIPVLLILCLSMGIHAQSTEKNPTQESPWTLKSDMSTARLGLVTTVVGDKIYAIGGYAGANHPGLTVNEAYDPATDTWTTCADMPTARHNLAASAVDGKIYVIGGTGTPFSEGHPGEKTVLAYDPLKD